MTKVNFLSLWVVVEQHTPLYVVQVNLEDNNESFGHFSLGVTAETCKMQNGSKTQKSESVYF